EDVVVEERIRLSKRQADAKGERRERRMVGPQWAVQRLASARLVHEIDQIRLEGRKHHRRHSRHFGQTREKILIVAPSYDACREILHEDAVVALERLGEPFYVGKGFVDRGIMVDLRRGD